MDLQNRLWASVSGCVRCLVVVAALSSVACSGSGQEIAGSGGNSGTGGQGGVKNSAGTAGSDGGSTGGSGGTTSTGGSLARGGTSGNSGSLASGGTTGSALGTGGGSANGGMTGTGGRASGSGGTGGGGATNTGGISRDAGVAPDAMQSRDAGTSSDVAPSSLLVPSQGLLFGAFIGSPATVASRESLLGRKMAIVHNFFGWNDNWVGGVPGVLAGGRIPMITWIPNGPRDTAVPLDSIIDGSHDTLITTRAQAVKAVGQKFFLRWGHEMNGNWTNWNASKYGSNAAGAAKFAQAWRHIHDIFTSVGATNALWVFCPNGNSVPVAPWNTWQSYYPGDAYVDWMSFDGYNFGTGPQGFGWVPFATVTNGIYSSLAATGKPIVIAEMSSSENGGDKAAWINAMLPAFKNSFPAIKALVWFDAACADGYTFCIDSSATASAALKTVVLDPYFNP